MSITVKLDVESDAILIMTYDGLWTWEEYDAHLLEAGLLIGPDVARMDLINLYRNTQAHKMPPNAFQHWRQQSISINSRIGLIVLVVQNPVMRMAANTILQMSSKMMGSEIAKRLRTAESLEDARSLILRDRAGDRVKI